MLLCELKIKFLSSFVIIRFLIRYGFYGDVITESEKYRWMGPKRYDYAGTKVFLSHRYGLWTKFVVTIFLLQLALFAILLTGHCLNEHPTDIAVHNEVFNL